MKQESVSRAIMVIAANLTPFAKQCLSDLMPKLSIEQFTENELLVNITEHTLVPEHR
jgi:DNA-directed RNA polymerase I, II, and III subunit RPABC1